MKKYFDTLLGYSVIYLIFIYAPIVLIILFSFNDGIYVAFPLKGFTFQWYTQMIENDGLVKAIGNSARIAVIVSIVSTILGVIAAKALVKYVFVGKVSISFLVMLPLFVPTIVFAISLLTTLTKIIGVQPNNWSVVAGHILLCVPFSIAVMISRLQGFDPSLEEASMDLGQNAWKTFWRVTAPLAAPGIVSSFLLCFTVSFDEYQMAAFLTGNEPTLPVYIFSQLRFPQRLPGTLALSTCILVLSFVLVSLAEWFRRRDPNVDAGVGI